MLGNRRGAKRRYTTAACLACRNRKIKCDNDQPRCSNCQLYDIDCVLGEDRRRTSSTRKAISAPTLRLDRPEGLQAGQRTAELLVPSYEQTRSIFAAGASPSFSSASSEEVQTARTLRHYGGPDMDYWVKIAECPDFIDSTTADAATTNNEASALNSEGLLGVQSVNHSDKPQHSSERPFHQSPPRISSSVRTLQASEVHVNRVGNQNGSVNHDFGNVIPSDPTLQLASRLGQYLQFAKNSQLRYYGATSNLNFISDGLLPLFEPSIRTIRAQGATALHQAGLAKAGSADYEKHLTSLYFSWHNSLLGEVNKEIYFSQKEMYESGDDSVYYSPTLANAIMAVGATYSTRRHPDVCEDPAEYYALRAKALLEIELDNPTIATAQALLVLSVHEGARTRDTRGWIYVGMAVQVVTDLGLHLGLYNTGDDTNSTPVIEWIAELRKNVFWATYTASILWSSYTGRPSLMNPIQYDVSAPVNPSQYRWEYYTERMDQQDLPLELDLSTGSIVPMQLARLATLMIKISNLRYTGIPGPISDVQISHVVTIAEELREWRESLPLSAQVDTKKDWRSSGKKNYLSMVLQLHMQYHEAMILLHRPFIAESRVLHSPSADGLSATQICTHSASEISRLLLIYRGQWGLQHINLHAVHVVMTAGIIHAYDCCLHSGPQGRSARDMLHLCLQALGDMGQTFQSGNRGMEVVMALLHDWQRKTFSLEKRQQALHSTLLNTVGS